jgi:hypothetical protein
MSSLLLPYNGKKLVQRGDSVIRQTEDSPENNGVFQSHADFTTRKKRFQCPFFDKRVKTV